MFILKEQVSGMGSIMKVSNKRSKKVERGREHWDDISHLKGVLWGRLEDEENDPVQSLVFVTVIWCLCYLSGNGLEGHPALLREVSPCGYSDQVRSDITSHLYWFLISFGFVSSS